MATELENKSLLLPSDLASKASRVTLIPIPLSTLMEISVQSRGRVSKRNHVAKQYSFLKGENFSTADKPKPFPKLKKHLGEAFPNSRVDHDSQKNNARIKYNRTILGTSSSCIDTNFFLSTETFCLS